MNDLDALQATRRLEEYGIVVRSAELEQRAKAIAEFNACGGNRAMRRAAARAARKKRS